MGRGCRDVARKSHKHLYAKHKQILRQAGMQVAPQSDTRSKTFPRLLRNGFGISAVEAENESVIHPMIFASNPKHSQPVPVRCNFNQVNAAERWICYFYVTYMPLLRRIFKLVLPRVTLCGKGVYNYSQQVAKSRRFKLN